LIALTTAVEGDDPSAELGARVALHGALASTDGPLPTGTRALGSWLVAMPIVERLEDEAVTAVDDRHEREPLAPGTPLAELRRRLARSMRRAATVDETAAGEIADAALDGLVSAGRLARSGDSVRDPRHSSGDLPPDVTAAMSRLESLLAVAAPPSLREAALRADCPPEGLRVLEASGRIIRVDDDLAWAATIYRGLEAVALDLATPGPLTPAALRDATGTSRKYVMALLEDLARRGVLRRTAEGHVRGPRAPR
jgi:selenocysteine-specific elongation factor